MSLLIIISDSLILSVVGLNPSQASTKSSRAEIRKYQCKHEREIPVLKCFSVLYSGPRKANGIFGFSESISKYCFAALFLNQFSYLIGNSLSVFSMQTHYSPLLLCPSLHSSLCALSLIQHNQLHIAITCNVKQIGNLMRHVIKQTPHNHYLKAYKLFSTPPSTWFCLLLPSKVDSDMCIKCSFICYTKHVFWQNRHQRHVMNTVLYH